MKAVNADDAISRQEAILQIQKYGVGCFIEEDFSPEQCERFVISKLNSLPSVVPKEKTGYWVDDADKIDAQYGKHSYKCPKCGKYASYFVSGTKVWWDRIKPNFCPNCGEKKQEAEDKNDSN